MFSSLPNVFFTLLQRSSNVSSASEPAALGTTSSLPRNLSTRGVGAVVGDCDNNTPPWLHDGRDALTCSLLLCEILKHLQQLLVSFLRVWTAHKGKMKSHVRIFLLVSCAFGGAFRNCAIFYKLTLLYQALVVQTN